MRCMTTEYDALGRGHRARRRSVRSRLVAGVLAVFALGACSSGSEGSNAGAGQPSSTGQSAVTSPALEPSPPVRVQIPVINVDSDVMDLGLRADGTLEVPPDAFPAGWFTGAPTPGELGPAIIVGHVDYGGKPGVFHDLNELQPGDEVTVAREDGSTVAFRITEVATYPKDEFPTDLVYGDLDYAGLRLITCGGEFDASTGSYEDNIIAFAELSDAV